MLRMNVGDTVQVAGYEFQFEGTTEINRPQLFSHAGARHRDAKMANSYAR